MEKGARSHFEATSGFLLGRYVQRNSASIWGLEGLVDSVPTVGLRTGWVSLCPV